jgi:hypothetical protein
VIPAEAAWAAAAGAWSRGASQVIVAHADRTDLIHVVDARLAGVRRFRPGSADASLIADAAGTAGGPVSLVGSQELRGELARVLGARGLNVDTPSTPSPDVAAHPELLAAAFASPDAAPALITESVRAARRDAASRLTARVAIAAGLLLIAAGALELWGRKRELASIDAQRQALTTQIASTIVGRTTVENAFRQLAALKTAEQTAPRWSQMIAQITTRLPEEAYLMGFRGRGDTVTIDGLAVRAARVFDAIERVPLLTGVRATAPVRIENLEDGATLERFAISGRVARPGVPGVPAAPRPALPAGARQ